MPRGLIFLIVLLVVLRRRRVPAVDAARARVPTKTIEVDVTPNAGRELSSRLIAGAAVLLALASPARRSRRTSRNRSCRRASAIRRPPAPPASDDASSGRRRRARRRRRRAGADLSRIEDIIDELEASIAGRGRRRRSNIPTTARRDPRLAGTLDPEALGLRRAAVGQRAAASPSRILMRRMDTPLASRWAHIGLRNALLAQGRGAARRPSGRLGRGAGLAAAADGRGRCGAAAGRQRRHRPLHAQDDPGRGAVALASSDPSAMCPLEDGLAEGRAARSRRWSPRCAPRCPAKPSAPPPTSSRRGGAAGSAAIDLALADKVVGAGAETARAVTIEWEPVDQLNSWRFGLATATGMMPPERLINAAEPADARLAGAGADVLARRSAWPSARIAAALGVLSSRR